LAVGIKNDEEIYSFTQIQSPSWPTNRGVVIDKRLEKYFDSLKEARPEIKGSIKNCIKLLSVPGPKYKENN
jgi:hypothetical protein